MAISLRRSRTSRAVEIAGPSLSTLACDDRLLNGGGRPTIRGALLLADLVLTEAIEAGEQAKIGVARTNLSVAIAKSMASDQRRLRGLQDAPQHREERAFLESRTVVLETRLRALMAWHSQSTFEEHRALAARLTESPSPSATESPRPSASPRPAAAYSRPLGR
jgi:hypothetical protein